MENLTSLGDWIRQRRKMLDLTQAALAQQIGCAVVTIKKIEQEVRRPSREMAELLAEQLALPQADRPRFLAMARGQLIEPGPAASQFSLPSFLQKPDRAPPVRFAPRPIALTRLRSHLQQALAGNAQICFLRGEAGRGKTSLLRAFAQQALEAETDLIAVEGVCSAHAGEGDPFLPFRDLFDLLTGDLETPWQAGSLRVEPARRLWNFLPTVAQVLLEEGHDLFDILVSPPALYARLDAHVPHRFDWLDRLQLIGQQPRSQRLDQTQPQLFEQITRVFKSLSRAKPLLLLLDDLQWIDETSLALLFHLSRRLSASRVMIVAAYRGSDVTEAHLLWPVVAEIARRSGDIVIDLEDQDPQQDRAFFEALIDGEPNKLDDTFRTHLFRQTGGHPLFTVELLRHLQDEQYLTWDEQEGWVQQKPISFAALPARVDAVINQRISGLADDLQELLRVAAVEGERFTAQVLAATLEVDERSLLGRLAQLAQPDGLIREHSHERIAGRFLNRYQFRHTLFQHYLYRGLSEAERRLLHQTIAEQLERLVGDQQNEYAMRLAYHFGEAGEQAKTARYHRVAGDQSRQASALAEAMRHYRAALTVWPDNDPAGRAEVLSDLADCLRILGQQAEALKLLEEAYRLFTATGNDIRAGDTLRRSGRLYWELGESSTGADYYHRGLRQLEACPESVELAEALSAIGRMHMLASENEQAVSWCQRAIKLAERLGAEAVVVHANNALGPALVALNEAEAGLSLLRQNIRQARELKLHYEVCCGYINLDGMLKTLGRYPERSPIIEALLGYTRDIHAVHYITLALILLNEIDWFAGNWQQALRRRQEIEAWKREAPFNPIVKIHSDTLQGTMYNDLNQPQRAYEILSEELERVRAIDELMVTLPFLGQLARTMAALGRPEETYALITEMVALVDRTPTPQGEGSDLLLLAHHWLISQAEPGSRDLAAQIREYLGHLQQLSTKPLSRAIWLEAEAC
ncbi:MAG: AAA family ATPase, partial [Anaerolineae bacterium]|nr:AAA family ATPase [Anaerolineae bacterium]